MRHRKARRRLSRTASQRFSLMRNLTAALIQNERIVTTEPKATELRTFADQMVTLAKREDLHARRQAYQFIPQQDVVRKLFETIGPRFLDRKGGYTRIYKLGCRRGDAAPMAVIEFSSLPEKVKPEKEPKKKKTGIKDKLDSLRKK